MSKNGIRVEEFDIFALGGQAVSYHLKDIHTIALQVTRENIGGLSLELAEELRYITDGSPFLELRLARGPKEEPEEDRHITVRPDDWLVILWDEIHLFKDPEFRSTFSFEELRQPTEKTHVHIPIGNLVKEVEESGIGPVHFGGTRQGESNQNQEDPNWQPEVSPALPDESPMRPDYGPVLPEEAKLPMEDVWAENDEELTQQTTIVPAVGELEDRQHGGNTRPVGE